MLNRFTGTVFRVTEGGISELHRPIATSEKDFGTIYIPSPNIDVALKSKYFDGNVYYQLKITPSKTRDLLAPKKSRSGHHKKIESKWDDFFRKGMAEGLFGANKQGFTVDLVDSDGFPISKVGIALGDFTRMINGTGDSASAYVSYGKRPINYTEYQAITGWNVRWRLSGSY